MKRTADKTTWPSEGKLLPYMYVLLVGSECHSACTGAHDSSKKSVLSRLYDREARGTELCA